MGEESKKFTLQGIRFTVGRISPRAALEETPRIAKLLGPAFAKVASGVLGSMKGLKVKLGKDGKPDQSTIMEQLFNMDTEKLDLHGAVASIAQGLNKQDLSEMLDLFLYNALAEVKGKTLPLLDNFDTVFDGKPMLAFQVLGRAVLFSYGNFTGLLTAMGGPSLQVEEAEKLSA